ASGWRRRVRAVCALLDGQRLDLQVIGRGRTRLDAQRLVARQLLSRGLLRELHQELRRRIPHGRERGALERPAARHALGESAAVTGEGEGVELVALRGVEVDAIADE